MKNKDLQAELVKRGCSKKAKRMKWLHIWSAIIGNKDQADDIYAGEEFIGAYWKMMQQDEELITDDTAHAGGGHYEPTTNRRFINDKVQGPQKKELQSTIW